MESSSPKLLDEARADRLTIAKLLLIVAGIAVVFAYQRPGPEEDPPSTSDVPHLVLTGLEVAGLPLLVLRLLTTSRKQVAPGEWLWATLGLQIVARRLFVWQAGHLLLYHDGRGWTVMYVILAVVYLLPLVFCYGGWWRLVTLPQAAMSLIVAKHFQDAGAGKATFDLTPLSHVAIGAAMSCICIAIWSDRRRSVPRYWAHWLGVALYGIVLTVELATNLNLFGQEK